MEKISLYFKDGSSDKEYHVQLDGGTVTVQYGRRGNALTSLTKCENCPPDKALKVYQKLIAEKKAKGYHEGQPGVEYSAAVNPDYVGYQPQLLNEIEGIKASALTYDDEWLIQEKEDGRNIGIILKEGRVIAANKKGIAISIPEKIVSDIENAHIINCTLCGELVGNIFKVWDAVNFPMYVSNQMTYIQRYKALEQLIDNINSDCVKLTRTAITTDEKVALIKEMKEKKAEGVVFKKKDSLYHPGRPASGGDQLKYKFTATCSVIAGKQNEGKRSVEMWLRSDSIVPIYVGNVTVYPNQEIPKEGDIIEVRYLYAYKGGSLFQPVLIGPRDDVDADECRTSQLKYKREIEEEEQ